MCMTELNIVLYLHSKRCWGSTLQVYRLSHTLARAGDSDVASTGRNAMTKEGAIGSEAAKGGCAPKINVRHMTTRTYDSYD